MLSSIATFAATRARKTLPPIVLIAALHLPCAQTCEAAGATEYSPTERPVTTSTKDQPKRVLMLFAEDETFPMITKLELTKSELRDFENKVEIEYLTDVTIAEGQARLARLPEHTIVLYGALVKDSAGVVFTGPESLARLDPTSAAPIYGISSTNLGSGLVGGSLVNFDLLGAAAAEAGTRILAGARPEDIAPHVVPNVVMFDWPKLHKWGISEKDLPPGSQVVFRQRSFLEQYRSQIAVAATLLMFGTLLIAGLWFSSTRRLNAENETARLTKVAEREHRRLEEFVSNVPGIVWETRMEAAGLTRDPELLSDDVERLLGYSLEEWFSTPDFWLSIIYEEDREQIVRDSQEVFDSGKERAVHFRWRAKDG